MIGRFEEPPPRRAEALILHLEELRWLIARVCNLKNESNLRDLLPVR